MPFRLEVAFTLVTREGTVLDGSSMEMTPTIQVLTVRTTASARDTTQVTLKGTFEFFLVPSLFSEFLGF